MMKALSFKITSDHLLLCVFLSLLWGFTDAWITSATIYPTEEPCPNNTEEFRSVGQTETSITLHWKKVTDMYNYTLEFNGSEINVTASEGQEHVTHTILELSSGTKYDFSLFTVFENVRSSGVHITAVTAPSNPEDFKPVGKNETSITLQWKKVNDILNYVLESNGYEINITASEGEEHVTHTISNLTSGTKYDFSLVTLFENLRSRGVHITVPVTFVLLDSECLSHGGMRVSCSSEGANSPQYSWTLDGQTLTDAQLLSGNNESTSIALKQNVSGQLVCSVRDAISMIPTCGFINTDCTLLNGIHISQTVHVSSKSLCIELTASSTMNTEDRSLLIFAVRATVVILLLTGIYIYFVWKKKKYETAEGSEGSEGFKDSEGFRGPKGSRTMRYQENSFVMVEMSPASEV